MNDQAQAAIESMVGQAVKKSREEIIKINAAVFGKFGHLQTDIPEVMRRADVKNPAVSVLGWGDWLKDNGLTGLQDMISNMNPKIVCHIHRHSFSCDQALNEPPGPSPPLANGPPLQTHLRPRPPRPRRNRLH